MKRWSLFLCLALLLAGCEFASLVEEEDPVVAETPELKIGFTPAGSFTLIFNGDSTKIPIPVLKPQDLGSKPYLHAHCEDESGKELLSLKLYLPPEAIEGGKTTTFSARSLQISEGFVVIPAGRLEITGGTWDSHSGAARIQGTLKLETDQGPATGRVAAYTYDGHPPVGFP